MARIVLSLTGKDRMRFLQGLVSNDLRRLAKARILYAALLNAQGKYLVDFFMVDADDAVLLDVKDSHADLLEERLNHYRLRADVQITRTGLQVTRGSGPAPDGAVPDPRDPALGWRHYGDGAGADMPGDDALRVAHLIPETGVELTPDSYILEMGFERLGGVDFRKGCYIGQEVTARMKHKTVLRKGLVRVHLEGVAPPPGTPILMADGREAGTLYTSAGDRALAWLRFDRIDERLTAGGVPVIPDPATEGQAR
ncbi:MAG: folate-binding protein YgfZ [Rubellimicrobium sp.]|nr:folate-binding protein YgfZ [Rubellimicrobium sp.]